MWWEKIRSWARDELRSAHSVIRNTYGQGLIVRRVCRQPLRVSLAGGQNLPRLTVVPQISDRRMGAVQNIMRPDGLAPRSIWSHKVSKFKLLGQDIRPDATTSDRIVL